MFELSRLWTAVRSRVHSYICSPWLPSGFSCYLERSFSFEFRVCAAKVLTIMPCGSKETPENALSVMQTFVLSELFLREWSSILCALRKEGWAGFVVCALWSRRVEQDLLCVCVAQVGLSRICCVCLAQVGLSRIVVWALWSRRVEQDCCVCFAQGGLSRICNPAPLNIRICNPRIPVRTFFRITDAHIQWCRIANPTQLKGGLSRICCVCALIKESWAGFAILLHWVLGFIIRETLSLPFFRISDAYIQWCRIANPTPLKVGLSRICCVCALRN